MTIEPAAPYGRMYREFLGQDRGTGRTAKIIEKLQTPTVFLVSTACEIREMERRVREVRGKDFAKLVLVRAAEEPQDFDRLRGLQTRLTADHWTIEHWLNTGSHGEQMRSLYGQFEMNMNSRFPE